MTDRELTNCIIGCPSYKSPKEYFSRFQFVNEVLRPVFNEFQLHKSNNDLKYMERNMINRLNREIKKHNKEEIDPYLELLQNSVKNYYHLFKGAFYQRYKLISFTTPYDTRFIPLEYNINGEVDLIIKTSYGLTYFNYVYYTSPITNYYDTQFAGTRLQIAGRCIKLLTGIQPNMLGLIIMTKRNTFKVYFKYLDQPYEDYLKIYMNGLDPIKKRYSILCKTCTENFCTPYKTEERLFL